MKALLLLAWAVALSHAATQDINLLRNNPDSLSNEGTLFALAFLGINRNAPSSLASANLYISTNVPAGATVTIDTPNRTDLNFPQTYPITAGITRTISFPVTRDETDISVNSPSDRFKAITVTSDVNVNIMGVNGDSVSSDGFLALPCKDFRPADGSARTALYKYFVFSTDSPLFSSRIVIVPCTATNANDDIFMILPDGTRSNVGVLAKYQVFMREQSGDFTGTVITSRIPISVFVGHECGQVPSDVTACDHLVEQIPPHAVYGNTFFAIPNALRESGELFKIGSVTDNNEVTITCTRRTATGQTTTVTDSAVINEGQYHSYTTISKVEQVGLTTANYRRDFCCIETSKPATVMQYTLGHDIDNVNFVDVTGELGDPSMSLVPPVEQYRNNYIVNTFDDVAFVGTFVSFMSWAIAAPFFPDPENVNDARNFMLNGESFLPPDRNMVGSGEYVPIRCKNGEVCGYGAYGRLPSGNSTISWNSPRDPNVAVYASIYGFNQEISYAYPAGYQCEPIGLPHVSVYDVIVSENVGSVTIPFNRTGGDLFFPTRILASTFVVAEGDALEASDFTPISEQPIRWGREVVDHRPGDAFTISITNDDIGEETEYFEVRFRITSTGYAFPSTIARVTILDDDGATGCSLDPLSYQVNEGEAPLFVDINVITTDPAGAGTSCVLSTEDGSADPADAAATGGLDYQTLSNFPVRFGTELTMTVRIPINNDDISEVTERFRVRLSSTSSDVIVPSGQDVADVTIFDTDGVIIGFDPASYSVDETDGTARLRIVKQGIIGEDFTFQFATRDGSASSAGNADFTAVTRTVNFPSTATEVFVEVPITSDNVAEDNENFAATISTIQSSVSSRVSIGEPMASVLIMDVVSLTVQFDPIRYTVVEGQRTELMLVLSGASTSDVTVQLNSQDVTTSGAADYSVISGETVTILAGQTTASFFVDTVSDSLDEGTESFTATLSSPSGAGLGTARTSTVFISDPITVQFEPAVYTVTEGEQVTFMAVLSSASESEVTVDFATRDGSATVSGGDYVAATRTITFPAGEISVPILVGTSDDSVAELTEMFEAVLRNPSEGVVLGGQSQAAVTILDNDDLVVQFDRITYSVAEGEGVTATLGVLLNIAADRTVTVDFTTNDGSALADSDFFAEARTITFLAGERQFDIPVEIRDDDVAELEESFTAVLSNPSAGLAVGSRDTATVFITDDVLVVQFAPITYIVVEGETASLTAVLNFAADRDVTVDFATNDGSALAGSDYTTVTTSITFLAGDMEFMIPVETIGDATVESIEMFGAVLSNPSTGLVVGADDTASVTITDDLETIVQFAPVSYDVEEGEAADLRVVLSNPSDSVVMVTLQTFDVTAMVSTGDYLEGSSTLTFQPGVVELTFPVSTVEDTTNELLESFTAQLSNPQGARLGDAVAVVDIRDNDPLVVQFAPISYTVVEGETASLTAVLNFAADRDVTVDFTTNNGSALAGSDYTTVTTSITFLAGDMEFMIPVETIGDATVESIEMFGAVLSNPSTGLVVGADDTASVTITDDDETIVQFAPVSYGVEEGEAAELIVVLSNPSDSVVMVTLQTIDGSAMVSTGDYIEGSTTLTFQPGVVELTFPVSTVEDTTNELQESFSAQLSNPQGARLGNAVAAVDIRDNDPLNVQFVPTTHTVPEGGMVTLTAELNTPADREVSVLVFTGDITASSTPGGDQDYTGISERITFPAGVRTATIMVSTVQDEVAEGLETFEATLSQPSGGLTVGTDDKATVNIIDDDVVNISFEPVVYDVDEGDTAMLEVVLSTPSDSEITVRVQLNPGTATEDDDYTVPSSTLVTFAPGVTRVLLPVETVEDDTNELDEAFTAVLDEPTGGAVIGSASMADINIRDDDPVTLAFDEHVYSTDEGEVVILVVVLDRPADRPLTFDLTTLDMSARDPDDYTEVRETFTIPAGTRRFDVPVEVIDDNLSEPDEEFAATLSNPSEGALLGRNDTTTITVKDTDDLIVQVENTSYRVPEGNGYIEVCAVLSNPASEDIVVRVSARERDPADAISGEDFIGGESMIVFAAGEVKACENISIIDDDVMETIEEDFIAGIDEIDPSPLDPVIGVNSMVPITIIDDDVCSTGDLRLQGGGGPRVGRVEICMGGVWGSICENGWDVSDATVVCRQLGFSDQGAQAIFRFGLPSFEPGPDGSPIYLDDVECLGTELRLDACVSDTITEDCLHFFQDVGVSCQSSG